MSAEHLAGTGAARGCRARIARWHGGPATRWRGGAVARWHQAIDPTPQLAVMHMSRSATSPISSQASPTGLRRPSRAPSSHRTTLDEQLALLDHASDGLLLLDADAKVVAVSGSYTQLLGRSSTQRRAIQSIDLVHPDDKAQWQATWSTMVSRGSPRATIVLQARDSHGMWNWVEVTLVNRLSDPAVGGIVATVHPIAGIGNGPLPGERLGRRAGLPGRIAAVARTKEALARTTTGEVLVLLVKLDQLHLVMRIFGQRQAAELAAAASDRLGRWLRPSDVLVRIDHDRLAVICPSYSSRLVAATLARRVSASLAKPFHMADQDVVLTASVGMAPGHAADESAEELVNDADIALASAVAGGGNRWSLYRPSDRADALEEVTLPAAVLHALTQHQFLLHYQPVVDLGTGAVVGFEALIRWARPDGTLLNPTSFIPVAERSGVISALGAWAMREACTVASSWSQTNGGSAPYVAVNMSARQLESSGIGAEVNRMLDETGIAPSRLVLEVTEAALVTDPIAAARRLHTLRELGVRIAIDDFGSGYSSLGYLKHMPVDILKIDQQFVAGLGNDATDTAIVSATISIAEALQFDVVAEGVETEMQAGVLRRLGAAHGQGFLFGRPGPVDETDAPGTHQPQVMVARPAPKARSGDGHTEPAPHTEPAAVPGNTAGSVLLADGDPVRRKATRLVLEHSGYTVGEASDGPAALHHASTGTYDLVVLSQGLVGMDTAEVLAHLRSYSTLPAIVVGDASADAEHVRFLDLGADDYLVRPSSAAEVQERIKVILRRGAMAPPSSRIEAGALVIDYSSRRVELRGTPVDLTIREFELLWFLMGSPDQTFSRQTLLEQVWGYTGSGHVLATVTEHVRRLRLKLERDPTNPTWILTEHGYGYRFATRTPDHRYPRT